jgi:Zinc dependent phospholipase C
MPPLGLHMTIARDLAIEIASPRIEADRGAYYLGATTPDIRVLTRWDRERTHFFRLDEFERQDCVHRLFEEEPALRDASSLDAATAAFMAGYISHLVMDEAYICQIYRPMFGAQSDLAQDLMANVMDRLLQFELDRRDREDGAKIAEIRQSLTESAVEVSVAFLATETLERWRQISIEVLTQPPTWDRFARIAGRHLIAIGVEGEEQFDAFMQQVPELLARTMERVGPERIREYLESAKTEARRALREYLS